MNKETVRAALNEALNFPIFSELNLTKLEKLCELGQVVVSNHRENLFTFGKEAQYFGFVLSGAYKLTRPTPSGDEVIVHFTTPGDFIAAFIMAQEKPVYPVTATAMGVSRFIKIPREIYIENWKYHPQLIFKIQSLLSTRMSQMHNYRAHQKAPLSAKIAGLLLELAAADKKSAALVLPLPLTRQEIADNLGSTVESVIRVMSDWSKKGYLKTSEQHITIVQPEKIVAEMGRVES